MDKLAAGIMIAFAALLLSGAFARDVMAAETAPKAAAAGLPLDSPAPVADGSRSGLV